MAMSVLRDIAGYAASSGLSLAWPLNMNASIFHFISPTTPFKFQSLTWSWCCVRKIGSLYSLEASSSCHHDHVILHFLRDNDSDHDHDEENYTPFFVAITLLRLLQQK